MTMFFTTVAVCVLARLLFVYASRNTAQRHARWRMRAKLADWVYRDKLSPVGRVKNGRIIYRGEMTPEKMALLRKTMEDAKSR